MKLLTPGGMQIYASPFLLVLIVGMCLLGNLDHLFLYTAALLVHEEAHFLFIKALGFRVIRLEVQPFGFSAQLDRQIAAWDEVCIAAAGPLCSLLCGVGCVAFTTLEQAPAALSRFGSVNFTLGFINLLPAIPMDGGRVLRGLLQNMLEEKQCVFHYITLFCACILTALGIAILILFSNPTALVMGVFLFFAAVREIKTSGAKNMQSYLENRRRIMCGEAVCVRHYTVLGDMTIGEAYRLSAGKGYTVWYVLNQELQVCARLDETQLLSGASQLGSNTTLFTLVDRLHESC